MAFRPQRFPRQLALSLGLSALLVSGQATPKGPPPAQTQAQGHKDLLSVVDEIAGRVVDVRGLALKQPVKRGVLSRTEITQKLKERIAKEYSEAEVEAEAFVLKRLGLLPENADYAKLLFELLAEQVAGFYDPSAKMLYIADWLPIEMQSPALAHEIEHALQDQHFDLSRFSQPLKEESDRQLARAALVEGDGTAVMLEFVAKGMGLSLERLPEMVAKLGKQMMEMSVGTTPAFHKAPAVLRETLIFPYAAGLDFVESIRLKQNWAKVDSVFQDPPRSTEQVLHPEKYWNKEEPHKITPAPLPLLAAYKEVRRDVLGELLFKVWFGLKHPSKAAEQAAAGWGGDRLVAYTQGETKLPLIVSLSTWDTEADAREAEAAATKVLGSLPGKDGHHCERRGTKVVVILGAGASLARKLPEQVFGRWKVG